MLVGDRDAFFGNGGDGAGYANADAVATAIGVTGSRTDSCHWFNGRSGWCSGC